MDNLGGMAAGDSAGPAGLVSNITPYVDGIASGYYGDFDGDLFF